MRNVNNFDYINNFFFQLKCLFNQLIRSGRTKEKKHFNSVKVKKNVHHSYTIVKDRNDNVVTVMENVNNFD